jgi:ABC-type transport system substrate-binding protein
VERKYNTSAQRLRALEDGEVDLIASAPPRHFSKVPKIKGARLVELSLPRMHVLQFNLNKREMRHRTLRRAIDLAIDRNAAFAAVEIKPDEKSRIVTGPTPFGSLGYNNEIKPRSFDPLLARALILGVRKELGGLGVLRFMHSGDETSRVAAEFIARSLERVGLSVSLVEREEQYSSDPLDADIRYESYTVSDPFYDVVTVLTRDNPTLAHHGSPWFRQLLVELIEAPNLSTAGRLLPQLHQVLFEDTTILPLWQWTDHLAVSEAVGGVSDAPQTVYHRIADWTVQPRFPPAEWDVKTVQQ